MISSTDSHFTASCALNECCDMRGDSIAISAELIDIKEIRPWMVLGTYFSPCAVGFISILAGYRSGAAPNPFLLVHVGSYVVSPFLDTCMGHRKIWEQLKI